MKRFCLSILTLILVGCEGSESRYSGNDSEVVGSQEIQRRSLIGSWSHDLGRDCDEAFYFGRSGRLQMVSGEELLDATYQLIRLTDTRDQISFEIINDNGSRDCFGDNRDSTGVTQGPFFLEFIPAGIGIFHTERGVDPFLTLEYVEQNVEPKIRPNFSISFVTSEPSVVNEDELTQFTATVQINTERPADLVVGLNELFRDNFEEKHRVEFTENFAGEYSFTVDAVPYNWGEGNNFVLKAWLEDSRGVEQAIANEIIAVTIP